MLRQLARSAIAVTVLSSAVAAQEPAPPSRWDALVSSGSLVPTGSQRDIVRSADLTAMQVGWSPRRGLALTGSLGWARSRDLTSADETRLHVLTLDLGTELRTARWTTSPGVSVSPFAGVGAGVRSYRGNTVATTARYNASAYISTGAEIGTRRVRARLEVRDYVSGFRDFDGTGSHRRTNDVVMLAGLRLAAR